MNRMLRFEPLLDWGNDLSSLWGPFRRRLPPKDAKIPAPFAMLWTGSTIFMIVFGALAGATLIYMIQGRSLWYPTLATGRISLLFVASYYATWIMRRVGFVFFYIAPALTLTMNVLIIAAWNRRARRLQKEGPAQEPEQAAMIRTWPPPPIYRK